MFGKLRKMRTLGPTLAERQWKATQRRIKSAAAGTTKRPRAAAIRIPSRRSPVVATSAGGRRRKRG